MSKFIKKSMSMLLLVSIVSTSVFPSSFASFAQETQSEQIINIDPNRMDALLDAQTLSNKFELDSENTVFKAGTLGAQSSPLGEEDKIAERFKIKDVVLDQLGDAIPGTDAVKETIVMRIGYDGEENLDNIIKTRIKQILIDEVSYELRDNEGRINFYLFEGKKLGISAAYPEGDRAIGDFKKREHHKVEITFDDGSVTQYQDPDYTPRDFTKDPAPPPANYDPKPKPPVQMVRNAKGYLVKTNNKKSKATANDALIHKITTKPSDVSAMNQQFIDIPLKFNEVTVQGATGQIKSISYETMPGNKREAKKTQDGVFLIAYPPGFLENENSTKDNEVNVEYVIEIAGKEPIRESAILILDWNNDFQFEGEDVQPPLPQPKDGIGNTYTITKIELDAYDTLKVTLNRNVVREDYNKIEFFKVNGKTFEQSKKPFMTSKMNEDQLSNGFKEVIEQVNTRILDELDLEIWFNDGSVLKNKKNNGPVQPPQEDEKEREVKGFLLENSKERVSVANKAIHEIKVKPAKSTENSSKKFYEVVIRLSQVPIGDDKYVGIKTLSYNQDENTKKSAETVTDYMYDSYKMLISAEQIQPKGSAKDTEIKVQYTLNTNKEGFNKPFDAILLLDWNGDFEEPGNFAKKFDIKGVEVKEDLKELRVTLNEELPASQLGLVKQVKVNDDAFDLQASDLSQAGDNKVLIIKRQDAVNKAKEKATTGWTLTLVFQDSSKLEYYVQKQTAPTPPPVQPGGEIAKKYKIKEVVLQGIITKELAVKFDKEFVLDDAKKLKKVTVNGTVFENASSLFSTHYTGAMVSSNENVVAAAKSKEPIIVEIQFNDGSILSNKTATPPAPADKIANIYQIKSVEAKKEYNELYVEFDKDISIQHANSIKNITINGVLFDPKPPTLRKHYTGKLVVAGIDITNAVEKANPITISITFADNSILSNGSTTPTPPPPAQPQEPLTGTARKLEGIESIKVEADKKLVRITFKAPNNDQNLLIYRVKMLVLDGEEFLLTKDHIKAYNKSITIDDPKVFEKASKVKDINLLPVILKFSEVDGSESQLKKNVIEKPQKPDFTIEGPFENGEYTLTLQAYKAGTLSEISTLAGFFDVRAKLVVSEGKKTVTLLNHTGAEMMLDFAVKTESGFKSIEKTNVKKSFKGEIASAEYSFYLKELSGRKTVAILGSGPMGGHQGEVGQYDSLNYKKAEIVFDNEVKKGWTDFKFPEDAKKNAEASQKRLIDALIGNKVDTNGDGQISTDELRNATGIKTKVAGEIRSNVIDLEGVKVDDISILKDLGPKIKVLNLNGCGIKELPEDVFQNATGLRELYLGGNHIKEIRSNTFSSLVNLESIDFDGNRLGALPEGIFDKNVELESLSLMNSGVTSVPASMLKNLSALKYLYLQENSITEIADEFFTGSKNLIEAHLNHNKLRNLPSSLSEAKRLKIIHAQHNAIKSIPDSFNKLKRLETLDLESNQIESIPTALYTNMIKLSSIAQVRLDLSMNNLTELPVDEMIETLESGGSMLTKFEVNKNYLKPFVSKDEENKMKRLGIYFENSKESYYPQKGSMESKLIVSDRNIQLTQEFDILELYYWDQGDSSYYGGKEEFKSKEEFLKYLLGEGRDYHKVDRSRERDVAIQEILNKKGVKWEVETIIMKNGQELSKTTSKDNAKEGLNQTFRDPSMKAGDRYTLTKRLLVKGVFGFAVVLDNTAEGTATGNVQPPSGNEKTVKVQIHKFNTKELSVANQAINPNAKIVNKDGKFEYTVEFKPLEVQSLKGNIIKFSIDINGKLQEITAKPATTPGYTSSYTFTLDEESKKVDVVFEADVMNKFNGDKPNPQKAHLVFGEEVIQPQPPKERIIKAYILKENEDKPSMANKALVHDVVIKAVGNEYEVKLQFKDMTAGQITAGVDSLTVTLGSSTVKATKVGKGVFTFKMPADMVKGEDESDDTKLPIKFTAKGNNGFEKSYSATLLLDWDKGYKIPDEDMPMDGKEILAQILTKDGKKVSMAGKALKAITVKPSDKTSGPFKLVTMTFKFKELEMKSANAEIDTLGNGTIKAGVKTLEVKIRDQWMTANPVDGQKGLFTLDMFENVIQDETSTTDTKFDIRITTYPEVPGHTVPQEAILVLDWNGDFKVDKDDNVITPPAPPIAPPGGGGSGPSQEIMYVPVWMKKKSDGTVSMGNRALSPYAKVVRDGSRYTYTITLNPIVIELNGQKFEGEVSNIQLLEPIIAEPSSRSVGDSKEYSFELDDKISQVLVSFKVDGAAFMGTQEAYIVFDWNGNNSAPGGGQPSTPGGGAGGTTIPENLVPLAGPGESEKEIVEKAQRIINNKDTAKYKKYYKPETIQAIMKALEAYQNKEKDSLQKLAAVLEGARLERITSILSAGYMSGYPNRQFRPNNKITRAEVSAMFMELIEDEAKEKVTFKDVKDGLWYSEAANKMVSLGYIRMNGEGMFAPSKAITRAEYAYILAKLKKLPLSDKTIKDVSAEHWAADAIASCIEAGIIAGYSDGTFRPDREITRAEAVAMMSRAFNIASNVKGKKAYSDVSKKHWAYDVIMTASKN